MLTAKKQSLYLMAANQYYKQFRICGGRNTRIVNEYLRERLHKNTFVCYINNGGG